MRYVRGVLIGLGVWLSASFAFLGARRLFSRPVGSTGPASDVAPVPHSGEMWSEFDAHPSTSE